MLPLLQPGPYSPAPAASPSPNTIAAGKGSPRKWYALAAAVVLLSPSVVWLARDHSLWPWDPGWYGEVTVQLYYTLRTQPAQWLSAMTHAFGTKAPGIAWLGLWFVPFGKKLGSIDAALNASVLLTQFGTLLLLWRIGRSLDAGRRNSVPLAGCLFAASAPLFVGMSHQFFVEPMQALAVAAFFFCALAAPQWPRLRVLSLLLLATSVAMLAKASSPLYCLLPGLIALNHLRPGRPAVANTVRGWCADVGFFVASLALAALTVAWYRVNWHSVVYHIKLSSSGDAALLYGAPVVLSQKVVFWYRELRQGLFVPRSFLPLAVLATAAGAALLVRFGRAGLRPRVLTAADWLALAAAAHLLGVLAMFSLSVNQETRYLLPALPAAAVLVMWSLTQVRFRWLAPALVVGLACQWAYVHAIGLRGVAKPEEMSAWLIPVERDHTRERELRRVVRLVEADPHSAGRFVVTGVELPWFNANTLSYEAEKRLLWSGRRSWYTSLGYAEADVEKAQRRLKDLNALYFLSLDESFQPPEDAFNRVNRMVLRQVARGGQFREVSVDSRLGIVLFRRIAD